MLPLQRSSLQRRWFPERGMEWPCWFYSQEITHQMEKIGLWSTDANSTRWFAHICLSVRRGGATPKCARTVHHTLMLLPNTVQRPRISCRNSVLCNNQIHISALHLYPSPNKSIPCTGLNTIILLTFLSQKAPANTIQFSSSFWKDQKIHLA